MSVGLFWGVWMLLLVLSGVIGGAVKRGNRPDDYWKEKSGDEALKAVAWSLFAWLLMSAVATYGLVLVTRNWP